MTIDSNLQWPNCPGPFAIPKTSIPTSQPHPTKQSIPPNKNALSRLSADKQSANLFLNQPLLTAPKDLLFHKISIKKLIENALYVADEMLHESLSLLQTQAPITPPITEGSLNERMAKREAELQESPYSNLLYAAIVQAIPSGWESLSEKDIDQILAHIDAKFGQSLTGNQHLLTNRRASAVHINKEGFQALVSASLNALLLSSPPPLLSNLLKDLEPGKQSNDESPSFQPLFHPSKGWRKINQKLNLLFIKTVLYQALGCGISYQINPLLSPTDLGLQMLNCWIDADLAGLMVKDLDEYTTANALEHRLIKESLTSFAFIYSLVLAQQVAPSAVTVQHLLKAMTSKTENPAYTFYASTAGLLIEGCQSHHPNQATRQFMRALAAKIEQDDDQLEKLLLLKKLLLEIMKKLMQLPGVAGIESTEINPETTDDSAAFFLQG